MTGRDFSFDLGGGRPGRAMADTTSDAYVQQIISEVVSLSRNEEACRLLGVDGLLEDQLDVSFLNDPLEWIAFDVASAVLEANSEEAAENGMTLATLVAEVRLYRAVRGEMDEPGLTRRVRAYLE